jgi:hypothetical protein
VYNLLKTGSGSTLEIKQYADDTDHIVLNFPEYSGCSNTMLSYRMRTEEIDVISSDITDQEYPRVINIKTKSFADMIKCVITPLKPEFLVIYIDKDYIVFAAESIGGSAKMRFKNTTATVSEDSKYIPLEPYREEFCARYISEFKRATNLCKTMRLYAYKGYPLIIEFVIEGIGILKFCLAPKEHSE